MKSLIFSLEKPEKNVFIYGLCDPDTNALRYIGLTGNGFKRISGHYNDCLLNYKYSAVKKWIKKLRLDNKIFNVIYIEYFDEDGIHVDESERFWIQYFTAIGCDLLNHEKGGRVHSDLIHYKDSKSKSLKNRKKSREHSLNIKKGQTREYGLKIQDDLGNFFNSLQEAADFYGSTKSTIQKAVYGQIKIHKGRVFKRVGGGRKNIEDIKCKPYVKKGRRLIENKIIDNDGNVYINASEAAEKLQIKKRQVFRLLSNECEKTKNGISLRRM
jgi:hypothetical protein